jgi:Flp pilus assembly protein CpaB
MEMEYQDNKRRGKFVIIVGVVLAVVAGATSFYLINQAQQHAGQGELTRVPVVVAIRAIPARTAITVADVEVRELPLDPANVNGTFSKTTDVVGRLPAVTILQGQLITTNMLASTVQGGAFSILQPEETVSPDSEAWRAISITVPPDLAVGGMLREGEFVDVFVTALVSAPASPAVGTYVTDRSTKIIYQELMILAREGDFYIIRAPVAVAEEILHMQVSGSTTFSMALRPEVDRRGVDATKLGTTTNRIIEKYGLPIPESLHYGLLGGAPQSTVAPFPSPAPSPTPAATQLP